MFSKDWSSFFSNKLTSLSNNYIDWSRTADLFRSRNHNYSTEQVVVRSAMILTTAASAFLGAYKNDEEKTHYSNTTMAIAAGTVGLALSHIFVVAPLIYKRYKMSADCKELVNEINNKARELPDITIHSLHILIDRILNFTLADEKRSNASLTWGRRKSLLNNLNTELGNKDEELLSLLNTGEIETILDNLKNPDSKSNVLHRMS